MATEYLPTTFKNRDGRDYTIHVTVRVAAEICRAHSLGLHELLNAHGLPFHILLDVAEIGTRYQSTSRDEGRTQFIDSIADENARDLVTAAGNALVNFTLRQSSLPELKRAEIAREISGKYQEAYSQIDSALMAISGDGKTSIDSPE